LEKSPTRQSRGNERANNLKHSISKRVRNLDDTELVSLSQQQDPEAFAELVLRHSPHSYRLAASILKDAAEWEDQVQTAYSNAWRSLDKFKQEASFATWITRIVRNQCLMRLRQKRRATVVSLDAPAGDNLTVADHVEDRNEIASHIAEKEEMTAILHREILRLPAILRDVIIFRHFKELPTNETARRLGISIAATKSRLQRARSELQNRMSKYSGALASG
jgi:RNA polymerase sigma-70 factor (ECF subfamily)